MTEQLSNKLSNGSPVEMLVSCPWRLELKASERFEIRFESFKEVLLELSGST